MSKIGLGRSMAIVAVMILSNAMLLPAQQPDDNDHTSTFVQYILPKEIPGNVSLSGFSPVIDGAIVTDGYDPLSVLQYQIVPSSENFDRIQPLLATNVLTRAAIVDDLQLELGTVQAYDWNDYYLDANAISSYQEFREVPNPDDYLIPGFQIPDTTQSLFNVLEGLNPVLDYSPIGLDAFQFDPGDIVTLGSDNAGYSFQTEILSHETWDSLIQEQPYVLESFGKTFNLAKILFAPESEISILTPRDQVSAEYIFDTIGLPNDHFSLDNSSALDPHVGMVVLVDLFKRALQNPRLTSDERNIIDSIVDDKLPKPDEMLETTHFRLRWVENTTNANIKMSRDIAKEMGDHLETALERYSGSFNRAPLPTSPQSDLIEVIFHDIVLDGADGYTHHDTPIVFDAAQIRTFPEIRQPTAAHELFHRIQYSYGYRIFDYFENVSWFSEGSASWAEAFAFAAVAGDNRMNGTFGNPEIYLFNSSYRAMPFWLFLSRQNCEQTVGTHPVEFYLLQTEAIKDPRAALLTDVVKACGFTDTANLFSEFKSWHSAWVMDGKSLTQ